MAVDRKILAENSGGQRIPANKQAKRIPANKQAIGAGRGCAALQTDNGSGCGGRIATDGIG